MAKDGAVFVFCSSCKILYFASSVHHRIATVVLYLINRVVRRLIPSCNNIPTRVEFIGEWNLGHLHSQLQIIDTDKSPLFSPTLLKEMRLEDEKLPNIKIFVRFFGNTVVDVILLHPGRYSATAKFLPVWALRSKTTNGTQILSSTYRAVKSPLHFLQIAKRRPINLLTICIRLRGVPPYVGELQKPRGGGPIFFQQGGPFKNFLSNFIG